MTYLASYLDGITGQEKTEVRAALATTLAQVYGTTRTADYAAVAADLNAIIAVQAGTTPITVTLMAAASAGIGAIQFVEKIDAGRGVVIVKDDTGRIVAELKGDGDRMGFTPNASGSGWHALAPNMRHRPFVSGNYYQPFDNFAAALNGSAVNYIAADQIYFHPIDFAGQPVTIDALLTVLGATSPSTWRIKTALYDYNPANPDKPDGAALLAEGAEVGSAGGTTASGSYDSLLTSAQRLKNGRGWAASKTSTVLTAQSQLALVSASGPGQCIGISDKTKFMGFTTAFLRGFVAATQPYADAFPATAPTTAIVDGGSNNGVPALGVRMA